MKIKQLKEAIKDLPDEMLVMLDERYSEFTYGLCNSATVQEVNFYDDDTDDYNDEQCLILSET